MCIDIRIPPFSVNMCFWTPEMSGRELFDLFIITNSNKCFCLGSKYIILVSILTNKYRSHSNRISPYKCFSSISIMQNKSEYSIKLINKFLNASKLFIKMQEYFTIWTWLKCEAVLLLYIFVVINLGIGNHCNISSLQRLVSIFTDIINSKSLETHNAILRNLF